MDNLLYIFINFFTVYAIYLLLSLFLKHKKWGTWSIAVGLFVFYCINTFLFLFVQLPFLTLAYTVLGIFSLTFLYNEKLVKRILAAVFTFTVLFLTEILFSSLGGPADVFEYSRFSYIFAAQLAVYAIVAFCRCFIQRREEKTTVSLAHWAALLLLPITSICVVLVTMPWWNDAGPILPVLCSALGVCNILVFAAYNNLTKRAKEKLESDLKKMEEASIDRQIELIRTHRCNVAKQLDVLNTIVHEENLETRQRISKLFQDEVERQSIVHTKIPAIDVILNSKIQKAQNQGIDVTSLIALPPALSIDAPDWITILENLLENAIDALLAESSEKKLVINMYYQPDFVKIEISNTFTRELILDKKKLPANTSKDVKLEDVVSTLDRYGGYLKFFKEESTLSVIAILFADSIS